MILTTIRNAILGKPQDKPIKAAGLARSSKWPGVRSAHLMQHPVCAVCGSVKDLQVHHKHPFHLHPELELDDMNLITLCGDNGGHDCHLIFGHLGNFSSFNATVEADAQTMNMKIKSRPKGSAQ